MNKFLLSLIIFLSVAFLIISKQDKDFMPPQKIANNNVVFQINNRNLNIKKIYSNLTIKTSIFKAKGFVAYEKNHKFHMMCSSFLGKELDIGSDGILFWFWSKNLKPRAIYYAKLEEVAKTRLRKVFYPELLKILLSIDELSYDKLTEKDGCYYALKKINLANEELLLTSIIKNQKVIGYKLTDLEYKIILDVQNLEFDEYLPKKIKIYWAEEGVSQTWELSNMIINEFDHDWTMPKNENKINLIDY